MDDQTTIKIQVVTLERRFEMKSDCAFGEGEKHNCQIWITP